MRLHRYLKESNITLDFQPLASSTDDMEDEEEDDEELSPRQVWRQKETILRALVDLLVPSGKIKNPKRCFTDLRNREAKATTGLGLGVAMPHVRTPQARDFAMGVAIAPEPGLEFAAIDEEPVRIFFPMVAPAYNDRYYRKVEKRLGEAFVEEELPLQRALLEAETPGEIVLLMRDAIDL